MFTILYSASPSAFITNFESGFINHDANIRVCKITFDSHLYDDRIFKQFSLVIPDTLANAVLKRRAEFLASRIAAQALFKAEDINTNVTKCPDAAPQWPEGWMGSISHTNQYAIVIIAPVKKGLSLGIDIEVLESKILLETADIFTDPHEQDILTQSDISYDMALLIAFSAKESLYKALYPKVKKLFGFDAAVINRLDTGRQSFNLELVQSLNAQLPLGQIYRGRYQFHNDSVITLMT